MPFGSKYVSGLDEQTKEKARIELNEVKSEISSHIETLRKWVKSQPHITCRTDDEFLLRFLRVGKYSQLKAQKRLDHYCTMKTSEITGVPEIFGHLDPFNEGIMNYLDNGPFIVLPGRDEKGCRYFYMDPGAIDPKTVNRKELMQTMLCTMEVLNLDPNTQINGIVRLMDMSNITLDHATTFDQDFRTKMTKLRQGVIPVREKSILFWNTGTVFTYIFAIMQQILTAKMKSRVNVLGVDEESLFKAVPSNMLPNELGGTAGTKKELKEKWKQEVMQNRKEILKNNKITVDESRRIKDQVVGTFRKLNID